MLKPKRTLALFQVAPGGKQEDGKSERVREKERKAENGERITPWLA